MPEVEDVRPATKLIDLAIRNFEKGGRMVREWVAARNQLAIMFTGRFDARPYLKPAWTSSDTQTFGYFRKWAKQDVVALEARKAELDAAFGEPLDWQALPEKCDARICFALNADVGDESDWPRQPDWLVRHAVHLHNVFRRHLAQLGRREYREDT